MPEIANALTIDVEDYFQVSALAPHIARSEWERMPCRVERNMDLVLEMLAEHGAQATFFTLGWIAERYPALVRRIVAAGHELASHGYAHERITQQTPDEFVHDIRRAKALLEDLSGVEVKGYRAPSFSIGERNLWAFDCIAEAGYRYSSSVYPIRHDHYGMPHAPRFPHEVRKGLLEIPVATARLFNRNLPAGGGGYFRLLPYCVSRSLLNNINRGEGRAAVFYLHPWELDADQPRVPGITLKTRFRHYLNLHRTAPRLRRLLHDFRWRRIDRTFLETTGHVLPGLPETKLAHAPLSVPTALKDPDPFYVLPLFRAKPRSARAAQRRAAVPGPGTLEATTVAPSPTPAPKCLDDQRDEADRAAASTYRQADKPQRDGQPIDVPRL